MSRMTRIRLAVVMLAGVVAAQGRPDRPQGDKPNPGAKSPTPRIVSIAPEPGAHDVAPGDCEIVIEFDRDMGRTYSFVGGGPAFPEVRKKPFWRDARTCVLTVWLKPNHTYHFSINGARHHGFASKRGIAVEPKAVKFRTSDAVGAPPASIAKNKAAIQKVRALLATKYSYRTLRKVTATYALSDDALAQAGSAMTFARTLASDLAAIGDIHIAVETDGTRLPTHVADVSPNVVVSRLAPHLTKIQQVSPRLALATAGSGIRYVLLSAWSDASDVAAIVTALRNEKPRAWILDMRANGGGNEMLAQRVAAHFLDKAVVYAKQDVDGKISARTLAPVAEANRVTVPVAVLMGPACFSSTEGFLLMMRQGKNVTLIGARSGGSSGNPKPHALGNGVTLWLPSWRALRPDGTCVEGEGIRPDVAVAAPQAALDAGKDPVLKAAVAKLTHKISEK